MVSEGFIHTSTDSGVTWTQQTNSTQQKWYAIASSSDGTVRGWMRVFMHGALCHRPGYRSCRMWMYPRESLCVALSDATSSTTHPTSHRNLPPSYMRASSIRRPTRASPGRSKPTVPRDSGSRSHPRRMARYVFECGALCTVHDTTILDASRIVDGCSSRIFVRR